MNYLIKHIQSVIIVILIIVIMILGFAYYGDHKIIVEQKATNVLPVQPPDDNLFQGSKISGKVLQYGSNHQDDIDKILVATNDDQLWFHFPPHTAKKVLNIAKINASVSIEYGQRADKKNSGDNQLQKISNKTEIFDVKGVLPPPPVQGSEITVTGTEVNLKKDDHLHITSFTLAGKLISLPPHAAENLVPLLQKAKLISVKGYERSNDGFVNINGLSLVRPDEIKIDNKNYLMR